MRIRGRIDRLDLRHDRKKVRVSDYKTGIEPENAENVVPNGGNEVQRVSYAIAARELMPHVPVIQARLVYLRAEPPRAHALRSVEEAIAMICDHVRAACDLLEQGRGLANLAERQAGTSFACCCRPILTVT